MPESRTDVEVTSRKARDLPVTVLELRAQYLNDGIADEVKRRLKELVEEGIGQGVRSFVLNLSSVGVMDSSGLSVLVALKKFVDGRAGRLALSGPSPMVQRIFTLTRLARVFEVYPSEDRAIRGIEDRSCGYSWSKTKPGFESS